MRLSHEVLWYRGVALHHALRGSRPGGDAEWGAAFMAARGPASSLFIGLHSTVCGGDSYSTDSPCSAHFASLVSGCNQALK